MVSPTSSVACWCCSGDMRSGTATRAAPAWRVRHLIATASLRFAARPLPERYENATSELRTGRRWVLRSSSWVNRPSTGQRRRLHVLPPLGGGVGVGGSGRAEPLSPAGGPEPDEPHRISTPSLPKEA